MPQYMVDVPGSGKYRVDSPEDLTNDQVWSLLQGQLGQSAPAPQPKEGISAAFTGGIKRFGSDIETALESAIDPRLAAERGVERNKKLGEQYAPGASLEKVKKAYEERGLFPAVGEAVSQVPAALAEQFPNMATAIGGARLGALAGSAIAPGVGTVVGGLAGAGLSALPQLYAQNLQRQAEEKNPEISRAAALGAALPGAALEVASEFIPLGRGALAKLLGPGAEQALKRGTSEAIEAAAKESLMASIAKGGVKGLAAEVPTEVAQQMLERLQAGLSLTDEEAQKEYGEAAYGAALVGGPFGVVGRTIERPAAREEFKQLQQEQADEQLKREQEEDALRPPEPEVHDLPGGFTAQARQVGETSEPEGYQIFAEGSDVPLTTVEKESDVQPKIERLNVIRQQETEKALKEIDTINEGVAKARTAVEVMEATGQTQTEQYMQAQEQLRLQEQQSQEQVSQLMERTQTLSAPLTMQPMAPVTRVQNEYDLIHQNEPGKVLGTFKTPEQAASHVAANIGPEEFNKQAEEMQASAVLKEQLQPLLKQFGLKDVDLKVAAELPQGAGGSYLRNLISVALDEPNPVQTLRHESVHALKDLGFFTPDQWRVLSERAGKEWINTLKETPHSEGKSRHDAYVELLTKEGENKGLTGDALTSHVNEALTEEAIADAFGSYDRGAKPPPGMIAALFKRIKAFFEALRNHLNGAGFQTADDIFGKIEKGQLKANKQAEPKTAKQEAEDAKVSLIRPAQEGEVEISTQNPSGKTRKYDPITQMLSIDEKAVLELMDTNPEYRDKTIAAIKSYGFIPKGVSDKDVIEVFKKNVINNLLYLYNLVPEDIRQRSKLWYDGANKIATEMADNYGLSLRQVSAILAAMSPQKDWFQNVSMGERAIDILTQHGDKSWSPEMLRYAQSYVEETKDRAEREKRQEAFEKIQKVANNGTTLNEMDVKSAAAFIRAYDEAFHSREYNIVTPEGGFGDLVRNKDGKASTMMWSTYGPIEKAVSIYRDGSRENVSEQLGFEHKIRSFYNNIAAPNSDIEHVTIDTHAVAAALFESLAGTDIEVTQNFGGTGKSDVIGVGGTYGLIADAYREAAKQVGVLPREMQSITWEAVRGLFDEDIKSAIKTPVREEWNKYRNGEQSFDQARQNILEISRNKRTNDKGVDIPPPDWVGSGEGDFVEDGGTSYNKDYIPEGGVRLRESKEIRDKLTFNLSAVTRSIPGLGELYDRALKRDEGAIKVLQTVAESALKNLLSGTNARVKIERANGVYMADREPSLMVSAAFQESEGAEVMAALARFAKNFNQQQIHVRMGTKKKFGFDYGDGSYVTKVYTIPLKKELNDKAISAIINKSGLKGFTVTKDELITYFVKPVREEGEGNVEFAERTKNEFKQFTQSATSAHVLAGKDGERMGKRDERLFVYGEGYGAALGYESISGNIRPKQGADTVTPRIVAEYLTGEPVQAFKQKPLNKSLVKEQQQLAQTFESLPVNDLKNPLVKRAYKALVKELKKQFAILPIKVELQTEKFKEGDTIPDGSKVGDLKPPYNNNSAAMRKDLVENNHLLVYPTTPSTFGPEGYDFTGHPLLEDSGFKDINNKPMLFNDVLRAVHDYFAHGMSESEFGPAGEYTAWRNHMASTVDPMARWALTAETRLQNAWQNFRPGAAELLLKDRPFALQKAALPPVNYLFTGDKAVDASVLKMIESLPQESQQGSKPAKLSLKAPTTPEFKKWFGDSKIVDANGNPKVMYHGTHADFNEFDTSKKSYLGEGSWFSTTPSSTYAYDTGANIMPVYLSLTNPKYLTSPVDRFSKSDLIKQGYDGVIVTGEDNLIAGAVAFEPTQIKSATGNTGAFDENNPDIRYSLKTSFTSAEAAKEATKDLKAPDTHEFKLFQGASKVLNEDGKAKLMFHGSKNIFFEFKENAPIFVAEDADTAQYFSRAFKETSKMSDQIYPVWVRAETPFDFEDMGHVSALVQKVGDDKILDSIKEGDWRVIEKPVVQKALKELGFDSFYVNEERKDTGEINKNLAVFKANQVKSATGNFGDFSEKRDMRFSLPTMSAGVDTAVSRVTTTREQKGWAERILGALAPEKYSSYRQAAINRYNRLAEADQLRAKKLGGTALLARNSAEAAALMSDNHAGVVASVMGVGNRRGGVPIIKNGMTMVDHSKKGVSAIFAPLAKYNDPKVYQYFQFYSAVKRGARLFQDGRERLIQPADIKHAAEIGQKFPEFEGIREEWVTFNNALVEYQKKAGVISDEGARLFTMYADYIPFYRQMDGEQTLGPKIYNSISGVRSPKNLKGGEAPLADFLETVVRNTHAAIGAGMKNLAAQRAVEVGKDVGVVHDIQPGSKVSALETITVMERGQQAQYQVTDQLFIDAVKSLNMPELPFMGLLSAPANLLRNVVTRDPGFIMTNLLRDSLSAYVTSGSNATPIAGTIINFGKALKGVNPAYEALMDAGIIGGYEFSANIEQSGATFAKDLAKKSGHGKSLLTPFTSVWDGLEQATTASDAATRMAVYERVMQETGDESEALYRAQEVMNFNRKGSSPIVRILTAAVPFLNARIQGLDVFYRASTGQMNTADAKEIQRKFFVRGMTMLGLSMMYYFAVAGNPDYEKQEQETKDGYWILPGVGKFPIPFEVGTLFKTVPERIAAYAFGNDTGEDFKKAMWRAANGFVPLSPAAYIPQTMKPILEAMTNYNFFTQREIVGQGMKDIDPQYQVGPGTSALAEFLGKLGLSPLKTDHVIKGYTGTMGMYAVDLIDSIMDVNSNSPKPAKRFEQMAIFKRFAIDPEARGSVTAYYDLKHTVDTTVRTMNLLEKTSKPEEYAKYLQDNVGILAVKPMVMEMDKTMTELRDMRRQITNSPMSATDKRDALTAIGQAEINLTSNIPTLKKAISELK